LALVRFQSDIFWLELGRYSLAILWIALLSTALLCLSRPFLRRLTDLQSGLISYVMVLMVTFVVTIGALFLENWMQSGLSINLLEQPGLLSNLLVAAILSGVMLRFFYLQAQYRRRIIIAADAKLQALQARIQPHFLFNSMNIIAGLIPINPVLAERVIEDLSDLFRASLAEHRSQVSLQSEIDLCKRYLGIEQLRLGERLQSKWQLPDNLDSVKIPPLTLQPLIENAIYHGIQPLIEGGTVTIDIKVDGQSCYIRIENPIANKNEVIPSADKSRDGNNIALNNVRERLEMLYQEKASLDMQLDQYKCTVILTLPCNEVDHENPNR